MRRTETGTLVLTCGTPTDDTSETTIYFDGSCPLCTTEIGHYASREGAQNLRFVDVSQDYTNLGDDLKRGDAMQRFHVRLPDGTLVSGAEGFVAVWEALPGWSWAGRGARLAGVMPLLELGYRMLLPVRPILSRIATWFGAKPANAPRSQG